MKIFLSYSRTDKITARQLVDALAPYHDVWCDWEDLEPGEEWRGAIAKGIRHCHVFLFLASEHSCDSEYCKWEIHIAQKWRKVIIPVIMAEGLPMHRDLARLQWVFLEDFERAIRQLLNAVRPKPSPHWVYVALAEAIAIAVLVLGNFRGY